MLEPASPRSISTRPNNKKQHTRRSTRSTNTRGVQCVGVLGPLFFSSLDLPRVEAGHAVLEPEPLLKRSKRNRKGVRPNRGTRSRPPRNIRHLQGEEAEARVHVLSYCHFAADPTDDDSEKASGRGYPFQAALHRDTDIAKLANMRRATRQNDIVTPGRCEETKKRRHGEKLVSDAKQQCTIHATYAHRMNGTRIAATLPTLLLTCATTRHRTASRRATPHREHPRYTPLPSCKFRRSE